jgi:hypothetical protein
MLLLACNESLIHRVALATLRRRDSPDRAGLRQRGDDLAILVFLEGAERFGADISLRGESQGNFREGFVAWKLNDCDRIILADGQVKTRHLTTSGFKAFLSGIEP